MPQNKNAAGSHWRVSRARAGARAVRRSSEKTTGRRGEDQTPPPRAESSTASGTRQASSGRLAPRLWLKTRPFYDASQKKLAKPIERQGDHRRKHPRADAVTQTMQQMVGQGGQVSSRQLRLLQLTREVATAHPEYRPAPGRLRKGTFARTAATSGAGVRAGVT